MARFSNRPEALKPPLERHDADSRTQGYIARAMRSHWLSKPLHQQGARGGYVPHPSPRSRGAVVKMWTTTKTGTTAAHTRSIAQAGKSIDSGYTDLFTAEDCVVDRQGCAQRSQDDPHQCRMIISLVEGAPLDLQAYTRASIAPMARNAGGTLEWIAAIHQDTAHVQMPVMIRGRDLAERDLYLTKRDGA
jgi:hypothetical protein